MRNLAGIMVGIIVNPVISSVLHDLVLGDVGDGMGCEEPPPLFACKTRRGSAL